MAQEKVNAKREVRNKIRDMLYLDHEASEVDILEEIIRLKTQLENFLDKESEREKSKKEGPELTEADWEDFFKKQREDQPEPYRYPYQWYWYSDKSNYPDLDRYVD